MTPLFLTGNSKKIIIQLLKIKQFHKTFLIGIQVLVKQAFGKEIEKPIVTKSYLNSQKRGGALYCISNRDKKCQFNFAVVTAAQESQLNTIFTVWFSHFFPDLFHTYYLRKYLHSVKIS